MNRFAKTPEPPYYAVIFSSQRSEGDQGYSQMADRMEALVSKQPGFLGAESARDAEGFGVTVSYWESLEAIKSWKQQEAHRIAQEKGKSVWYEHYITRICKVEKDYSME